jgi:hypothetical protein
MLAAEEFVLVEPEPDPLPVLPAAELVAGAVACVDVLDAVLVARGVVVERGVVVDVVVVVVVVVGVVVVFVVVVGVGVFLLGFVVV